VDRSDDSAAQLYSALMNHALHQDRMLWDIAKIVIVLQGLALGSSFAFIGFPFASLTLLLAAAITLILLMFAIKAELDRDVNKMLMCRLADDLIPSELKSSLQAGKRKPPLVRLSADVSGHFASLRGSHLAKGVLLLFAVIDIALAVAFQWMKTP